MNVSETIVELREAVASSNHEPGDYEVVLEREPLVVRPGGTVSVRNAFIDSSVDMGERIVLTEADCTDVSCTVAKYIQNWDVSDKGYNGDTPVTGPTATQPDNKPYFVCNKVKAVDTTNVLQVNSITIHRSTAHPGTSWGRAGLQLTVKYPPIGAAATDPDDQFYLDIGAQPATVHQLVFDSSNNKNFPMRAHGTVAAQLKTAAAGTRQPVEIIPPPNGLRQTDWVDNSCFMGSTADVNKTITSPLGVVSQYNEFSSFEFRQFSGETMFETDDGDSGYNFTWSYTNFDTGLVTTTAAVVVPPAASSDVQVFVIDASTTPNVFPMRGLVGTWSSGPSEDYNIKYNVESEWNMTGGRGGHGDGSPSRASQCGFTPVSMVQALTPFKETIKLNLTPSGKKGYAVSEICEMLTEQMTHTPSNITTYPLNSPFIRTNNQIRGLQSCTATDELYYTAFDGSSTFTYSKTLSATTDYYVGTDQMALVADDVVDKVKFQAIHANFYDEKGAPATKYIPINSNGDYSIVTRNGGIVFLDLTPRSLWEKLGFDFSDEHTVLATLQNTVMSNGTHVQKVTVDVERFTTQASMGISDGILKTNDGNTNPWRRFGGFTELSTDPNSSESTDEIFATNPIDSGKASSGYYLIDIDMGVPTDFVSNNLFSNRVQAIISKFYSESSYTSAYDEGSVVQVNNSDQDIIISRFRVRILDPDGNISSLNSSAVLGQEISDNTVFLRVQNPPPVTPKKQTK